MENEKSEFSEIVADMSQFAGALAGASNHAQALRRRVPARLKAVAGNESTPDRTYFLPPRRSCDLRRSRRQAAKPNSPRAAGSGTAAPSQPWR